jgi:hypothetical protein
MVLPMSRIMITVGLATAMWVVPSMGTHGQGTLGDRFVHVDRAVVRDDSTGHALLRNADRIAAAAVAGL